MTTRIDWPATIAVVATLFSVAFEAIALVLLILGIPAGPPLLAAAFMLSLAVGTVLVTRRARS